AVVGDRIGVRHRAGDHGSAIVDEVGTGQREVHVGGDEDIVGAVGNGAAESQRPARPDEGRGANRFRLQSAAARGYQGDGSPQAEPAHGSQFAPELVRVNLTLVLRRNN